MYKRHLANGARYWELLQKALAERESAEAVAAEKLRDDEYDRAAIQGYRRRVRRSDLRRPGTENAKSAAFLLQDHAHRIGKTIDSIETMQNDDRRGVQAVHGVSAAGSAKVSRADSRGSP
jgi:hypothetical protein